MSLILLFAVFGCGAGVPCTLEDQAWALVPADATGCSDDLACFAFAVEDGQPAVAMTSRTGIDSVITTAHVWTGDRLWWLEHDDYGWSGGASSIDAKECVGPRIRAGEVVCESVAPEGNHYTVCGNPGGGAPAPLPFERDVPAPTPASTGDDQQVPWVPER